MKKREFININKIPPTIIYAFLSAEDKNFLTTVDMILLAILKQL